MAGGEVVAEVRRLDRGSPLPLWAQLVDDLRRRIDAGAFADRFPTEAELVDEYEVSRHTVREALRRLRTEGTVVAERGRGSYLAATRFEQPLGVMYSLFRTIEAQGVEQRSEVRSLSVASAPQVAERLGLPRAADLVVLERRRLAGGEPLALDTAWLPASVAAPLLDADFTRTALYDELAARCGVRVDGGSERIAPTVPTPEQRRLLGLPKKTAVFCLHRLASAAGTPVEWRETLIRGDRYRFVASWSAATTYRLDLVPD